MSDSVNLVPVDCLVARSRCRRRTVWAALTLGIAAFVLSVWAMAGTAGNAVERAAQRLQGSQARQQVLAQVLSNANERRAALVERLQLLASLRHVQPWAQRLATLANEAPTGIVLTRLSAAPEAMRRSRVPPAARPGAGRRTTANKPNAAPSPLTRCEMGALAVQLSGLAASHDELTRFIETLQRNGDWGEVELTRALRQPYLEGYAVGFEIVCVCGKSAAAHQAEGTP